MKAKKWDINDSKETIKLAHAFFSGNMLVNRYKQKEPNRKVVSTIFPLSELIYAMDAIPLFPTRYDKFKHKGSDVVLNGITNVTKTFGWNALDNLIKLAFFTRAGAELVESVVDNLIDALNARYTYFTRYAEQVGFPSDSCYSARLTYGLYEHFGNKFDLSLNLGYRCSFLYKMFESLDKLVGSNYTVEIPLDRSKKSEQLLESQLVEFIEMMEQNTGNRFSEDKLKEIVMITNEIKELFKRFIFETCTSKYIPYNPVTFANIQTVMLFSFIDMNSNIRAYRANFKSLISEMENKISKHQGYDASKSARILLTPVISGFDPATIESIAYHGGIPIIADWEILGFLEPVSTSGNMVRNYARYLLNLNQFLGWENELLAKSITRVAQDMNIDGLVYQTVFGCKNMSPVLHMVKNLARRNGIPITALNFSNIGEGVEQNKTRIEAFLEMLKE